MTELIIAIVGFVAAMIGAAVVGSKLNESKHKSDVIKDQSKTVLDMTLLLHKHDRIDKDEIQAIQNINNVGVGDIDRVLCDWPEVSGVFKAPKPAEPAKRKSKKLPG